MATNKNQHFVPRCYLRPFTLEASGAAISLINLDRKKLISNAPVKNQCSRDYFYGSHDTFEEAIQLVESNYARTLRALLNGINLLSEDDKTVLKTFWLFQHLRTEAAAMRAVEMANRMRDLADISPTQFSLEIKDAVQIACGSFLKFQHLIDDLKFCIFKNKSGVPFITSDNPAVLTNKWRLERDRSPNRSFGIGSAGMLAILPLSPKLLFLGYDGDVYRVPKTAGVVEITNSSDVIALNRHQFLQCVSNVYLHDACYANMLINHYSDVELMRPAERHIVHYAQIDRKVGDSTRYAVISTEARDKTKEAIMHSQVVHPNPMMWTSKIQIRSDGAVYTNGTGLGYVRRSRTELPSTAAFWKERP